MSPLLDGLHVVELSGPFGSIGCEFLESLGAHVTRVEALDEALPLLAAADVLVEYSGCAVPQHPRLIHASLTPFGAHGPYARYRGSELVCSAMSGVLRTVGDRDRPPVKEALDACWFHAHAATAAAIMLAYHERELSGRGQHVDVSVQEVAASRLTNAIVLWQFDKRALERSGQLLRYGRAAVRCIWKLRDGYAFHSLMTGSFGAPANGALSRWLDELGYDNPMREVDWLRYDRSALPAETRALWEAALACFFGDRSKAEVAARPEINAAVLFEPEDVLADPQLHARGFWKGPARPAHFVKVQLAAAAPEPPEPGRVAHPSAALAGVKVLDLSWALVGSLTTKGLADHGACVVKLESTKRPCLSRLDVQVHASTRESLDDKPWFAQLNTSKLSVALDLKHARAREVIAPLVAWADVVVENFSPGTLDKLGLGYESLRALRPDVIMISASAYGQTGPLRNGWGVDGTSAARSGRTLLSGWPDRDPVLPGAVPYADAVVPQFMIATVAAALARRRHTGQGGYIDVSMYEISVQQMAAALEAAQLGAARQRAGNQDPGVWHQGVYPTRGDDRHIAISLFEQAECARLCNLLGSDGLDHIAESTRTHDAHALMHRLQSIGIAAGVVQDVEDLLERDPQLRSRPAWVKLDHARLGPFEHQTTPYHLERTPGRPTPAPLLGEHTERVCVRLLGMAPEHFRLLRDAGLFV
jgi:crotonobetainyl-CoA:carnitine CoA-transferase CaiB-like acyl-CoA transferase